MNSEFDSAGVPWEGRSFSQNNFANDSGDTSEVLRGALAEFVEGGISALAPALFGERVLVPLLAEKVGSKLGPHGLEVDEQSEMAIVAIATPDQQTALPIFGSVSDLKSWRDDARPIPIEIARAAAGAVAEGHRRLILNPAGEAIGLRFPLMRALATGSEWISPERHPEVIARVEQATNGAPAVQNFQLKNNDSHGKLQAPELMIELTLRPGLTAPTLDQTLRHLAEQLQQPPWPDLVDSFGFRLLAS